MKSELANQECQACNAGTPPLKGDALRRWEQQLDGGWTVAEGKRLEKQFRFKDFRQALDFTNRVGQIAESQGHHPDIRLSYGEVDLELSTHSIHGLSQNDFILAAKINAIG